MPPPYPPAAPPQIAVPPQAAYPPAGPGYPPQQAYHLGQPVPYGQQPAPYVYFQPQVRWNGLAIAGFVLSFIWYLWWLGVILSAIGLAQTRRTGERGRGLAIAGVIVGSFFTAIAIIAIIVAIVVPIALSRAN
jgi:hypothetical protein